MHLPSLILLLGMLPSVWSDVPKHQFNAKVLDFSEFSNLSISSLFADYNKATPKSSDHQRRWAGAPPAPASNDIWEKVKCKGRKFMAQMSYSDFDVGQMLPVAQTTAQSPWYFVHLTPWAYVMSGVDEVYRNFETGGYWGVADFFRHIKISDKCQEEGGLWNAAVITHYKPGTLVAGQSYIDPNGYKRRASGAFFYMAVNPQGGIIVQNTLGPRDAANKIYLGGLPDYELPPLQKLSDMMWMMWEYYIPAAQRTNLDFFMSLGVNNPTSLAILRRALDSQGQVLTTTPYMFDPNSDGGLALLGSPNGARVAHFLIQRKAQVGLKTVVGIYAFECLSRSHAPCLMFKLGNLAAATPRPQAQLGQLGLPPTGGGNAQVGRSIEKRTLEKQNFVRTHTFRFDGNMTLSSEFV